MVNILDNLVQSRSGAKAQGLARMRENAVSLAIDGVVVPKQGVRLNNAVGLEALGPANGRSFRRFLAEERKI